jgi:hypothetical protein
MVTAAYHDEHMMYGMTIRARQQSNSVISAVINNSFMRYSFQLVLDVFALYTCYINNDYESY